MEGFIAIVLFIGAVTAYPFNVDVNPSVVGGRNALEHEAPYMLLLQVDRHGNGSFQHVCGATILTPTWALSAAHCITEVGHQFDYQVVAGEHDLIIESGQEQRRAVIEYLIHDNFVSGPVVGPFDIMVLRLESALTFIPGVVETIRLPPTGVVQTGQATLFGWGSTSLTTTPSFPSILQTVSKPIVSWELCREIVNAVMGHEPLHYSNFCTGAFEYSTSACNGDSGGPLVQAGADGSVSSLLS